ncbi:MAG: selenocysteine-specific translation elongation factor [Chloroflexi bacterium]|nr:MAG: selenocysteine-specific translation elongation factor [Chloroflexota bacterium]MBL1193897.1 selenocysteine-specific translation elongation factor [Chloroflexota bacterium]NOH11191.1 selenocysteine-specific translation elongation factor [Chloroflexota bacterium]
MRVIGTAGHVDHGKSTLIEALTGTHPDRLAQERQREMSIELGFAWWTLPNGEEVGVVDVPGHRDFIENMLSGVGGIDAVLFVVAADEGVMPQTHEHLAIVDLLQIEGGIVALSKVDMVEDDSWLDLVEEELVQVFSGTVLEDAPIVRVSAKTGHGLEDLQAILEEKLSSRPARQDLGRPRLPVDRVFTIAGFGTVTTGTLLDGALRIGDEVEVLPRGLKGRIRGLQTHKEQVEEAVPGSRTAVNISGVDTDQLARGQLVAHPGSYEATRRLDVHFRLLPDVSQPLAHNTEVKLFVGAAEVIGRVRLLGVKELAAGDEGWLQLELRDPVVAARNDRYILRRPSPGETLGGGVVVDPHPTGRHKRFDGDVIKRLETLSAGTPRDVLLQAALSLGIATPKDVIEGSKLSREAAEQAIKDLVSSGDLLELDEAKLLVATTYWNGLQKRVLSDVENYHQENSLRLGMSREELKSRLKLANNAFNALTGKLVEQDLLVESGPLVHLPGHEVSFSAQQQKFVEGLLGQFAANPMSPPSVKQSIEAVGEDVYRALVDLGQLLEVSAEVVFRVEDYERMLADVKGMIEQNGSVTVAQVRDKFNTTRRYVLAFLEYLDTVGITVRDGDARRLRGQ